MSAPTLTPEAKQLLSSTIRDLRTRLLRDFGDEAERRYRLSVRPAEKAGLDEAHRERRKRLEAWIDERSRAGGAAGGKTDKDRAATRDRFLLQAVKEAAATLLNRVVLLRHLEALKLSRPAIVTGGWNSPGYQELRDFAPGLTTDETEGYATLLQVVFDDLAIDLPGLFGDVGLTRLFPVPPATLREIVSRLDAPELATAWTDDTTLGWVYQYWNDPEREALDAKINDGGKIQPHELASKTQMFTERYMVEWLLQNSLGLTWLCICRRNGWTPDAERVLPVLEERRISWRKGREAGEVALDALMPIEGELESAWKYYVPQPLPPDPQPAAPDVSADAAADAATESTAEAPPLKALSPIRGRGLGEGPPTSIRDVRLLDPACGSGHFLTAAFDLLVLMYREEARHRGESWSDAEIAEAILARNLHGIDIDPRAVQIAAAGLYLKAKALARTARPTQVNLVAPTLQLGNLPDDDPALAQLRHDLKDEVGIPEELTHRLISSLAGVDHLGTLLKVDTAVEDALKATDLQFEGARGQGDFFGGFPQQQGKLTAGEAKANVLEKLEQFLNRHSTGEDLGLRFDGEQLAAGVRFVRLAREGTYDIVVGNPPYQGLSKTSLSDYVAKKYQRGKADLCTAFLERGLELARPSGLTGLVAMRAWMFLGQFAELRKHLLHTYDLRTIGDLDKGAFEGMVTSQLISVAMTVFQRSPPSRRDSIALQPTAPGEKYWGPDRTDLKRAAILAQRGRYEFDPNAFEVIDGEPLVYWWGRSRLDLYARFPLMGTFAPAWAAQSTGDNTRFTRTTWEVPAAYPKASNQKTAQIPMFSTTWYPLVAGADGAEWFEPCRLVVNWRAKGLEIKQYKSRQTGREAFILASEFFFFRAGVTFSKIGAKFSARRFSFPAVFCDASSSLFPEDPAKVVCLLNSTTAREILQSLNPTVNFQAGDVNRLPVFPIANAAEIFAVIERAFTEHESHREASLEFKSPGASPWRAAQHWAQRAVDRPEGTPLPVYAPELDPPAPEAQVSFAIGVALGRFGANGEGVLNTVPPIALPASILFIAPSDEVGRKEFRDSVDHPACAPLHGSWKEHGSAVGGGDDLRTYLRRNFFVWHKGLYEKRPIYFPLSSAKKSYVAFVSIHRWQDDTLQVLLTDHLLPEKRRLDGELEDIRQARIQTAGRGKAEKRFAEATKLLEELADFIEKVTALASFGPPSPDDKTPRREVDSPFVMDLDDGVMVNSAALWPLLEPQWKDPKKWWRELATAQGRKDYDWAHLSARYFPKRVREKCVKDPSLAVAHKCFWDLHPAKAYAWELCLQDEIRPDFTIDEPGSDDHRARFLNDHPTEASELLAKETQRRARKAAKTSDADEYATPLLDRATADDSEDADA